MGGRDKAEDLKRFKVCSDFSSFLLGVGGGGRGGGGGGGGRGGGSGRREKERDLSGVHS